MSYLSEWLKALDGRVVQSYKPIVCLALFELADSKISKKALVDRVSKFFWRLEDQFSLKHGPVNNVVHSKILECVNQAIKKDSWKSVQTELWTIPINRTKSRGDDIWDTLTTMPLKKMLSSTSKPLYSIESDHVRIPYASLKAIKDNRKALKTFARCRLGEFLEKNNSSSPRISQKIEYAWQSKSRPGIPAYMISILQTYHSSMNCYICGQSITGSPDWDHVLPFSFIGGHDLWNFMPSCGPNSGTSNNCNQKKSNKKPKKSLIQKTVSRNNDMLNWLRKPTNQVLSNKIISNGIKDLEFAIKNKEVTRLWNSM